MALFRQALIDGIGRARRIRLLLPLYLCGLLLGLLQIWPLLAALGNDALYNPFLGNLARGGGDAPVSLLIGDAMSPGIAALWAGVTLPLTAAFSLAYTLFSGGIVNVYARTTPFWPGCLRNFWPFVGLGALLLALVGLVAGLGALIGSLLGVVALPFALLALQFVGALGEYARAFAAVRGRRNPFALAALALRFLARRPGALLLALVGLLLHLALALLYAAVAGPLAARSDTLGAAVALIVWQQLALIAWIWVKLLRLAWAVSYIQAADQAVAAPQNPSASPIVVS